MNDFTINLEKQLTQIGRDIQDFVTRITPVQAADSDFSPACDIVESDVQYRILMDLPGLGKKDIHLELKDNVLTISGERDLSVSDEEMISRSERESGAFSRSFALPESVKVTETDARFRNGVLTVTIPKAESKEQSHSIPVN